MSETPYTYDVRYDAPRNVLYLRQAGHPDRAQLARFRDAYRDALRDVKPGWVLVHDQREVAGFTDEALEVGKELVEMTNTAQPAAVIRIAPGGLATRARLSRVLVAGRSRYKSLHVATPEEAEAAIASVRGGDVAARP